MCWCADISSAPAGTKNKKPANSTLRTVDCRFCGAPVGMSAPVVNVRTVLGETIDEGSDGGRRGVTVIWRTGQ